MVSFRSAFAPLSKRGNFGRRKVGRRFNYSDSYIMVLQLDVDTRWRIGWPHQNMRWEILHLRGAGREHADGFAVG